jgi:hypothetical protein
MAAGISSTKQVYPPSWAGSKTAVNFILRGCHAAPSLASLREERFAHAEHGLLNTDHWSLLQNLRYLLLKLGHHTGLPTRELGHHQHEKRLKTDFLFRCSRAGDFLS